MTEQSRPRFGSVIHEDQSETPVYFIPFQGSDKEYSAINGATGEPVEMTSGDVLKVDVIGPGQSIVFKMDGEHKRGQFDRAWNQEKQEIRQTFNEIIADIEDKEKDMDEEKDQPRHSKGDPNAIWRGLGALFALGGFVLLMTWGIVAIIRG